MVTRDTQAAPIRHLLWGSVLSPFALKLRACFQHAGRPHRCLPVEAARWENALVGGRIELAKLRRTVLRFPQPSPLDEYPLVPFLVEDRRRVFHDSSSIARWLDATSDGAAPRLFPAEPRLAFVAALLDEAFDEFGLYLLHHGRWVVSAADNNAAERLAGEFAWLLPSSLRGAFARRFARRQVARLPYLFSVAPAGFSMPGVPPHLTPASRAGFPPTHALLDQAWGAYVDAVEALLARRPWLLGQRFTIADAGAFGHLGGSFIDPSARRLLQARSPRTYAWLERLWRGAHVGSAGELALGAELAPLLRIVARTFVPLMQQNEAAFLAATRAGETVFNERAFNRGRSLYDGELLGQPFRAVVKTFQVQVWRDLRTSWLRLTAHDRGLIEALADCELGFDARGVARR